MAHVYRFFGGVESGDESRVVLGGDEAHHALHVVRVKAGDLVEVFDGAGNVYQCRLEGSSRREVECSVESCRVEEVESPVVVVSLAWLNKDKSVEELIQRCTALGVGEFRFFRGDHSGKTPKESAKWRKWAIESCKQCGRGRLPEFSVVVDGIEGVIRDDESTVVAMLSDLCVPLKGCLEDGRDVNIVIGPEGDFSDAEEAFLLGAGGKPVSLGKAVFRSQAAASVLSSLVLYELGRIVPLK